MNTVLRRKKKGITNVNNHINFNDKSMRKRKGITKNTQR